VANWIAVIAFGNCHLTKAALASFLAQDIPVNVLIINNASSDGTAPWMATLTDERIMQVHFSAQRSVAACWNFAMRTLDGESHVLIANNDVVLRPETYRLLLEDGGPFVTAVGVGSMEQMTEATLEPQNKRPNPDFSCFLLSRSVWNVHKFDERYLGGFAEDAAYHATLHKHGIAAHCIGVPFYHVGSASVKYAEPERQKAIMEQADRNRELFLKEWGVAIGTPEYDTLFTPETFGVW
jgi:hypothetical protein